MLQALAEAAEPRHFAAFRAPLSSLDVAAWLGAAQCRVVRAAAAVDILTAIVRMPFAAAPVLECQEGFTLLLDHLREGSGAHAALRIKVVQLLSIVLGSVRGSGGASTHGS